MIQVSISTTPWSARYEFYRDEVWQIVSLSVSRFHVEGFERHTLKKAVFMFNAPKRCLQEVVDGQRQWRSFNAAVRFQFNIQSSTTTQRVLLQCIMRLVVDSEGLRRSIQKSEGAFRSQKSDSEELKSEGLLKKKIEGLKSKSSRY